MAILFYDMNEGKWYVEKANGEQEAHDSYTDTMEVEEKQEQLEYFFPQLHLQLRAYEQEEN